MTTNYHNFDSEPDEVGSNMYLPELSRFLAITTPDKRLILDSHPSLTFQRFIEYIGEERLFELNITVDDMPLIAKEWPDDNAYEPTQGEWYALTHISVKKKIAVVEQVGELLGQYFACATKRIYY